VCSKFEGRQAAAGTNPPFLLVLLLPTMPKTPGGGNKRSAGEVEPALGESISKRSSGPHGFSTYIREFRSVLHHPMGMPLIRAFHRPQTRTTDDEAGGGGGAGGFKEEEAFPLIKEYFPDFFADQDGVPTAAADGGPAAAAADGGPAAAAAADADAGGGTDPPVAAAAAATATATSAITADNLFHVCHTSWRSERNQHEPALTKKLAEEMGTALKGHGLTVAGEAQVKDPFTGNQCRMDALVSKRMIGMDGSEADRPLLVVEVGLKNMSWWSKVDQGLRYLKYQTTFGTSEAALLSVVTLEEDGDKTVARLGVFLVTPKVVVDTFEDGERQKSVEFRVTLLWHDETHGIDDLSRGFGTILRATCKLPGFIVASRAMLDRRAYRYLGPNCCLIAVNGEKVGWIPSRSGCSFVPYRPVLSHLSFHAVPPALSHRSGSCARTTTARATRNAGRTCTWKRG
jgi:hypothetical protein